MDRDAVAARIRDWMTQYEAKLVKDASFFAQGAINSFFNAHKEEMVQGCTDAALDVGASTPV